MEEVCIPLLPPPGPPAEEGADSNVMTLPTLEATWTSSPAPAVLPGVLVWNPDSPVMEEAALGTSSLFPVTGTMVAGGVLLASLVPKDESKDDMGSTRRLAVAAAEE